MLISRLLLGGFLRIRADDRHGSSNAREMHRNLARRLQALHDDIGLHLPTNDAAEPSDHSPVWTLLVTVHKDSSQYRTLLRKAAFAGRTAGALAPRIWLLSSTREDDCRAKICEIRRPFQRYTRSPCFAFLSGIENSVKPGFSAALLECPG